MRLPESEAAHLMGLWMGLIGWSARRLEPRSVIHDAASFREAPMQDKAAARDSMLDSAKLIDEYVAVNPHGLAQDDLVLVGAWRAFVRGDLVAERDLKQHTVLLDWTEPPVAYAVLSLTDEIVDLLPAPLPMLIDAVLLPWKGAIVCDGIIRFKPVLLGPGIRRQIRDAYRVAKARGVVTTLGGATTPTKSASATPTRKRSRPGRRRTPDASTPFVGTWRIVAMDQFDEDYFEREGPAYVEVEARRAGRFSFGLVSGEMDCRFDVEGGRPLMEFSWEGNDEHHPVMGRGRAVIDASGTMRGRIYTHHADDTGFTAKRVEGKSGGRARKPR